jgi:hypothetical protein
MFVWLENKILCCAVEVPIVVLRIGVETFEEAWIVDWEEDAVCCVLDKDVRVVRML